ncbi:hypothetical protein ACGFZU_35080 [Streptomyces tendae]|uniref:hypothetical protein n=1 Tax=Streptomyces tendae TaxID=1932 RepID=UPI00371B8070
MSDPESPLAQTLARIDELCTVTGKVRDELLNVESLARATGLSPTEVQLLLLGGTPPELDPDVRVRMRVRLLYERDDETSREIRDIAAGIGQTTTWTKKLVEGDAKPNLVVGHRLAKYYGVAPTFLTDPPAEALNRELQPILVDLEIEADPGKTLADLGLRHIARRNPHMEQPNLVELAKMVAGIVNDLNKVTTTLQQLQEPEENR